MQRSLLDSDDPVCTPSRRWPAEREDEAVIDLVQRLRAGCPRTWDELVQGYGPLVRSVAGRFRLSAADAQDVGQAVWVKVYERIGDLREPLALPGWLAVVTANECRHVIRTQQRTQPLGSGWEDWQDVTDARVPFAYAEEEAPDAAVLRELGIRLVRDGLAELAPRHRELLLLLVADPPVSYAEIGARMGVPVGSIGPTRARALKKLRETRAVRTWIDPDLGLAA